MSSELDKQCAAALGRPWSRPTHGTCCTCQTCGWDHDNCQCGYSDDEYPEKTRLLEDEIERRGLWAEYTEALVKITESPHPTWEPWALEDVWNIIRRPTPEQRARAFLAALNG